MRRYSVWNPSAGLWDYYQAQGDLRAGVFAAEPKLRSGHRLGLSPEEAARALPMGATLVGRGPAAVGMVASRNGGGGSALGFLGFEGGTLVNVAVLGGAAYLLWNHWLSSSSKAKVRNFIRPARRR